MAIIGSLYRCAKAGYYAIKGDAYETNEELDKAIEALKRPTFSEIGSDFLDWFED